jgi:hypothetical protein
MAAGGSWTQRDRRVKERVEDDALDRLMEHLRRSGSVVELVARPDRGPRPGGRAVDAEMLVDGRIVAVEVTQVNEGARDHVEVPRLQASMQRDLEAEARRLGLGLIAIGYTFRPLPPKSRLRAEVPVLKAEIMSALSELDVGLRSEVWVDSDCSFVRNLRVSHYPDGRPGVGWGGGSVAWGGWMAVIASDFAARLVATKGDQGRAYEDVWIVVVSRMGDIEADDLERALLENVDAIPPNWSRVWYLGINGAAPVAVPMPRVNGGYRPSAG